jgi:uncharacterized RmlC-like cupin family protein
MKTVQITPAEMERRIARFRSTRPQSGYYADSGIPKEAYELMTAKTLYLMMAPPTQGGPMAAKPAIVGAQGMSLIVAECPPGDKPLLHVHFRTNETFMVLKGRFRIRWGDHGEHEVTLEPFDVIAVPPGVCRDFTNVTDETAYLLAIITGQSDEDFDDIAIAPDDARMMRDRFGPEVIEKIEATGVQFMSSTAD